MVINHRDIKKQILETAKEHHRIHSEHNPEAWFLKNDAKYIKRLEKEVNNENTK